MFDFTHGWESKYLQRDIVQCSESCRYVSLLYLLVHTDRWLWPHFLFHQLFVSPFQFLHEYLWWDCMNFNMKTLSCFQVALFGSNIGIFLKIVCVCRYGCFGYIRMYTYKHWHFYCINGCQDMVGVIISKFIASFIKLCVAWDRCVGGTCHYMETYTNCIH